MNIKCPLCGFKNEKDAKFCIECNEPLHLLIFCPYCGINITNLSFKGNFYCENCQKKIILHKNKLYTQDEYNELKKAKQILTEERENITPNYLLQILTQYSFRIPERTRDLLWVSEQDPKKFEVWPGMPFYKSGIYFEKQGISISIICGQYNEPSLIWSKWRIIKLRSINEVKKLSYYPSYGSLDPFQRWTYLNWLCDVSKPIDIGYVFLYYYGLERHLIMGDFENAFMEILYLIKHHKHPSLNAYALTALTVASFNKKRFDLMDKIPYKPEYIDPIILLLKAIRNTKLLPDEVIALANRIGFKNNRYIKKYPNRFKNTLTRFLLEDEASNNSHLLSRIKWEEAPEETVITFANYSFPPEVRSPKIHNIIAHPYFNKILYVFLNRTHNEIKSELRRERKVE